MYQLLLALAAGTAFALPNPAPAAASTTGNVCTQSPYSLILPFSSYAPAQSYCSSKYPVAAVTTTKTIAGQITTVTVTPSKTATVTQAYTSQVSYTSTTTVTFAVTATTATLILEKRNAAPVAAATSKNTAAEWSSCTASLNKVASAISTACSCIQTGKTVTKSVTGPEATVTVSGGTRTTTTTTSFPGTTQSTAVYTTTTTVTQTVQPPAPACTNGMVSTNNGETFNVYCDTDVTSVGSSIQTTGDTRLKDCIYSCSLLYNCYGARFDGTCQLYLDGTVTPGVVGASQGVTAAIMEGSVWRRDDA